MARRPAGNDNSAIGKDTNMSIPERDEANEIKVIGFIGKVVADGIAVGVEIDEDGTVYRVAMDDLGKQLLKFEDEEVYATGVVTGMDGNIWLLRVTDFDVYMDDEYSDDDDDDYFLDGIRGYAD